MSARLKRFRGPGSRVAVTFDMPTVDDPEEFQVRLMGVLRREFSGRIRRYVWARDPNLAMAAAAPEAETKEGESRGT